MTAPELSGEMRNLIDARLDQIERVLLRVDVSYSERRHIVGEVESQIFELLARRTENPARDDVQAVLDSLDPAEAYVPEEFRGKFAEATSLPPLPVKRPRGPRVSKLAVGSALLAAGILLFGFLVLAEAHQSQLGEIFAIFAVGLFGASICGLAASVRILLSNGQLKGLPISLFAVGLLPLAFINLVTLAFMAATHSVIPWLIAIAGMLYLNYRGLRWCWRWIVSRQDRLVELLRGAGAHMRGVTNEARAT